MISFIISVGAFVIGVITVLVVGFIAFHLGVRFYKPILAVLAIVGVTIFSLVVMSSARADSIDVNLTSYHADKSYNYNSNNYGLGYTKDLNKNWQARIGVYDNSYNKTSVYGMFKLKHNTKDWRFGIQFGIVTGYDNIEVNNITPNAHKPHRGIEARNYKKSQSIIVGDKNKSKYQVIVIPTVTYKFNKTHALEIGCLPGFDDGNICDVITYQYQYSL